MAYKQKQKKERLTTKRLNYLIADEKKASAEYKKYGFTKLAEDEKSHQKFLENIKKKRKKCEEGDDIMSVVDDIYGVGEDVVQRANPFTLAGNSMGYSDEKQKRIRKGLTSKKKKKKKKK